MGQEVADEKPIPSEGGREGLFRALLACSRCSTRRLLSIRRGELLLLQQDGRLPWACPQCQSMELHRLIRIHS